MKALFYLLHFLSQGQFQATIIGEALREKDVPIGHVYTSPSLRCVETATSILEGMFQIYEWSLSYLTFLCILCLISKG